MKISTSILNAENRLECIKKLNNSTTNYIHIDVMDGKFVEDTQINTIEKITTLANTSDKQLDIHLMVENPLEYIQKLDNKNIKYIIFHLEIQENIEMLIQEIKAKGYLPGIAINPETNIEKLIPYLNQIDLILIMSVKPGRGGQKFIPTTVDKIAKLKKILQENKLNILIEVDGGINDQTIKDVKNIDIAVAGSYIIKSPDYNKAIQQLLNN